MLLTSRSQWPRGLRCRSAAARLLRLWVPIPPGAWMSVCCDCYVLSGRGRWDELVTRPEESYRLWRVVVCDLETSWMRRPWPTGGCRDKNKKKKALNKKYIISEGRAFPLTSNLTYKELKRPFFLWEDVKRSVLSESAGLLWKPRNLFRLEELSNLLFFTRDFTLDYLTFEDGRDRLLRNVGKELALYAA